MATTLYCAIDDLRNRLSADGVSFRIDDDPPDDYGDVLDEASAFIDSYVLHRYAEATLATSRIVKHWCANVAACLLCERRGNPVPKSLATRLEWTIGMLERVMSGKMRVADIQELRVNAPTLSQPRIVLAPVPHTKIERMRSTRRPDPTDYVRHDDRLEWWDPSI